MANWREMAAAALPQQDEPAASFDNWGLDPDVAASVRQLPLRPTPRLTNPDAWAVVMHDMMLIARDGWAAKAVALGWSVIDLFGIGPRDSHEYQGLAVWLDGARLILIDAHMAVADTGNGRAFFNRGGFGHGGDAKRPPVPLWQFGRR